MQIEVGKTYRNHYGNEMYVEQISDIDGVKFVAYHYTETEHNNQRAIIRPLDDFEMFVVP